MDEFLGYLNEWESATEQRTDLSAKEKRKLLLSSETMEGLRITGKAVELTLIPCMSLFLIHSDVFCRDGQVFTR